MEDNKPSGYHYRSLFWPLVLIGVGVLFLLANLGIIERVDLAVLLRLWPVILIVIGLDLVFGRRSPIIGGLIGLAAVALVLVVVINAPNLGLTTTSELRTERFTEPIGEATSATVNLELWQYPSTVEVLAGSDQLIDAELTFTGDIDFEAEGDREKVIDLRHISRGFDFDWLNMLDESSARWDIGLSPEIPLDVTIDVGSGSARLDLAGLQLTALEIDGGSGSTELRVSAWKTAYPVDIRSGSGSFRLNVPAEAKVDVKVDSGSGSFGMSVGEGADVEADVEGGSGSINIDVPDNAAIRVRVTEAGSGSVNVPSRLRLIDDGNDSDEDTGTWETEGFDQAEVRIEIIFDGGSGSFNLD